MDEARLRVMDHLDGYRPNFTNTDFWRPYVLEVCQRHGFVPCQTVRAGLAGSFPTFIVNERWVVKLFGRLFDGGDCFDAELEALRIAGRARLATIPQVLVSGDLFPIPQDWPWPYFIMDFIPGVSIGQVYDQVALEDRLSVARQMGDIARRMHDLPLGDSGIFQPSWSRFRQFLTRQRDNLAVQHAEWGALPPRLLNQLEEYVLPVKELIDEDARPHLIHADLTADHLLGQITDGRWQTNGLIDFGDAVVGNLLYELQALHLDLFKSDRRLLRAFLDAYGLLEKERASLPRRAMSMALLHQFNVLDGLRERLSSFGSLSEAADELWNVNAG